MQDHQPSNKNIPSEAKEDHLKDAIPIQEVPKVLPRHHGKPVHKSTIHRWIARGRRGVRLPTVVIGGRRYVRPQDLQAWIDRLNQEPTDTAEAKPLTPRQRQKQHDKAHRRAQEILVGRNKDKGGKGP